MDSLRVRVYNVRFGDAILVSIPERTRTRVTVRHLLFDVGNSLSTEGGADALFEPIIRDILTVLDGNPLDLYVMTHEHMDHVQGLFYAATRLGLPISARYAWLTASAAPDYYDRFLQARKKLEEARTAFQAIEHYLAAAPEKLTPLLNALLLNNNPNSSAQCVAHLRQVAAPQRTTYVFRGCAIARKHPFKEAKLQIIAPEEDTSVYYGRLQPMALNVAAPAAAGEPPTLVTPKPPSGVDAGAFYNLITLRRHGLADNLLAIDRAANNSSVVLYLEWRGWRLLFPGDAERKSWEIMDRHGLLKPVHFLKVSHHGSANGTPPPPLLDKLLPPTPPDDRPRRAVVSTYPGVYSGVPDELTLAEIASRCQELVRTDAYTADKKPFFDFLFHG